MEEKLDKIYVCKFCDKTFTRKVWYDKHTCEKKKRFVERHNIPVIRAHKLFNHWQRRNGYLRKEKEKTMDQFIKSPLYELFKSLSMFAENNYLVSAFKYLNWLIDNNIPSAKWCDNKNLGIFLEDIRINETPMYHGEKSVTNIKIWCDEKNIPYSEFFNKVTLTQAYSMVIENKLSPWVIFGYEPALTGLIHRFENDLDLLYSLDEHINISYWLDRIEQEPENVTNLRDYLNKMLT